MKRPEEFTLAEVVAILEIEEKRSDVPAMQWLLAYLRAREIRIKEYQVQKLVEEVKQAKQQAEKRERIREQEWEPDCVLVSD
jgi:hypothetical protein